MTARLVKVDEGRWRVRGVGCRCGGDLFILRAGEGEFRYETFCAACLRCDPNGWRTLQECLAHLDYFGREGVP